MTRRRAGMILVVLAMAAAVGPAWAAYSLSVSTFAEASGRAAAGTYEMDFTLGQASPVGSGAAEGFGLTSGILPALADASPPVIFHAPVALAAAGAAVAVEADVEDPGSGVDSVVLHYREGGLAVLRTLPMQRTAGTHYTADIPAQAVTERGLAYYIEATDGMGNKSRVPVHAPDSLQNLPVYSPALTSDINLPAREYRMVSIPGTPTAPSADSVLVDDYGPYDRKAWRLGRWRAAEACTTGCYDEYPDIEDFAPGRAFWLILDSPRMFDLSCISTDASRPCLVRLARGWNQIGTPYAFSTRWSDAWVVFAGERLAIGAEHIVGADTILVEDNLIAYDGAYEGFRTHLGAWSGYWVYNASTAEVDIAFPPVMSVGGGLEAVAPGGDLDALFAVRISRPGEGGPAARAVCYAGLADDARDGWDTHDLHSPPPIGDGVTAVFRRDDWGGLSGDYMTDIRGVRGEGQVWAITVEARPPGYVAVETGILLDPPGGWRLALYDRARGVKIAAGEPYVLEAHGRVELELVAGTERFIAGEEAQSGMDLATRLLSVMPNPFAGKVTISFHLGSPQRVSVTVYDIEGGVVANPVDEVLDAGVHSRTWDGATSAGRPAAAGVYFLRMVAGDTAETAKIVRLK